jgi:hypothetical protein
VAPPGEELAGPNRFPHDLRDVLAFAQVDNVFDEKHVFRRGCVERVSPAVCARHEPVPNDFQVWLAPRAFLAGITLDMDFTR